MRWRITGTAIAWMWSGVTPAEPVSHAQARDAASSAVVPRGLTPSLTDGLSRVPRARSTAYPRTSGLTVTVAPQQSP